MLSTITSMLKQHNLETEFFSKDFLPSFPSPYMHSTNNEDYTAECILTDYIQAQKSESDLTRIYTICGGGDTTPSLLCSKNDITIDCVDKNETQIFLCDLKIRTLMNLETKEDSLYFLLSKFEANGNSSSVERKDLYGNGIRQSLYSDDCRLFWDNRLFDDIQYGIIGCSQYDRILSMMINGLHPECNNAHNAEISLRENLKNEYLDIVFNYGSRPNVFKDAERVATHHKKLLENFQCKQNKNGSVDLDFMDNYYYTLIRNLDFAHDCANENGYPLWLQSQYFEPFKFYFFSVETISILYCCSSN